MNAVPAILFVEDDQNLGFLVRDSLEMAGFQVDHFEGVEPALKAYASRTYQLCILDVMLPDGDGFGLAKSIRQFPTRTPIIFLTAMGFKEDRIKGFQVGADDYVTKPFSMEELILRVKAILLRTSGTPVPNQEPAVFRLKDLVFDPTNYNLSLKGQTQRLTRKEALLLELFLRHPNTVLDRERIQKKIWEDEGYVVGRSLDVFVSKLRKILRPASHLSITNLHGIGYRFEVAEG